MFAIIPQLLNSLFMHPVYGLKSPDLAETMSELAHSQRRSPKGKAAVEIKSSNNASCKEQRVCISDVNE